MKTAGSWASLLRGVSQQAPEARLPGQHEAQTNLLSDPVAGLTRRHGTIFKDDKLVGTVSEATALAAFADANGYRTFDHQVAGKDYVILMRSVPSAVALANALPPTMVYNKTDHVWLPVDIGSTNRVDTNNWIHTRGVATGCSVGEFFAFAIKNTPCSIAEDSIFPGGVITAGVAWVRGGAYDRTYTIRYGPGGTGSVSYTTPSAGTTGAAAAISPQAIAGQLSLLLTGAGLSAGAYGAHVHIPAIASTISVSDGGDGSLLLGCGEDIPDSSRLPLMGQDGQVVRIGYSPGNPGYYVKATTKGGTGFGECVWRETGGVRRNGETLTNLGIMQITNPGGGTRAYFGHFDAANPSGGIYANGPNFVSSTAGDRVSNPTPRWMNAQVTYMGMFQDRLMIGSDASLAISAAGDYFNFFRSTVTTVPLKDAFEMTAQGGEDDILRHGVNYNKNIVIFGDKKQYLISGSTALTPTSPNMAIMTVYPEAATCPPLAAGGQIYYARNRRNAVAVHQIQPGVYVDSAESFPASAQIGSYIPAPAADMMVVPGAPSQLLMRSRSDSHGLYVFSYLDQPDGRKQDSWSRFVYNDKCGRLLGLSSVPDGFVLLWARYENGKLSLVADLQPMSAELSDLPYLDSLRTIAAVNAGTTEMVATNTGWSMAFDKTTDRWLIGGGLEDRAELQASYPAEYSTAWVGLDYEASFIPTNPFKRDESEKAVLSGRLVVSRLLLNLKASAGLDTWLTTGNATTQYTFNGRVLGDVSNQIGQVPVSDSDYTISVGRESREYSIKIAARRWYPFTCVGIEWTGQSFNRTPRA